MPSHKIRQTKRRRRTGGLSFMAVAVVALASLTTGSSNAAEDPTYPGLPKFDVTGGWVGPRATAINYAQRAKQWVRVPAIIVAGYAPVAVAREDNSCGRLFPYKRTDDFSATLFFRSSKGAKAPYGYVGPFTARTVAFGSIPVEASIELRQLRDGEDLPIGLTVEQKTAVFCPNQSPYPDVPGDPLANYRWLPGKLSGQLEVAVTGLKVDGVDLELAGNCRTGKPGAIEAKLPEYYNLDPSVPAEKRPTKDNLMTTDYFGMANGGLLNGTVDIPAFEGCVTRAGEDISRLLTATISGADNPVSMRSEGLQAPACMVPGTSCPPLPDLPFPTGN